MEAATLGLVVFVLLANFINLGEFGCGINLMSIHLLIYGMIAIYLSIFISYSDLIILYFLKREMEEKIGFLLFRKKIAG